MSASRDKNASLLPELIVFDVNETLSDISGLEEGFSWGGPGRQLAED